MNNLAGLIYKPHRWVKGAFGRTKEGKLVQNFDVLHSTNIRTGEYEEVDGTKDIVAWSLHGGIIYCYDADYREKILEKVRRAILSVTGRNDFVAQFNDRPETTFEEVARVIREAKI